MQYTDFIREMNAAGAARQPVFFAVDFDGTRTVVLAPGEAAARGILFRFPRAGNCPRSARDDVNTGLLRQPVTYQRYREAFDIVARHIANGDTYLANLTLPTPVQCTLSLKEMFERSRAPYRILFGESFTVFSPETFVRIADGRIVSCPMKGTIDAAIPDAERAILTDRKESAEHNTIVDLIRNDIGIVARNVRVERFRYIDRVVTSGKTLLQVSSEITGELPENWPEQLGATLAALLPAGSVTGAPKRRTVEILREAEQYDRGYYTGIAGYFDGQTVDSCVLIRFIERSARGLVFKSGGGITCFSDPALEYQELLDKVALA